ncbi:hypothetical protein Z043_121765 [Scleropages formosus]|uniref:hydroperoxy icosatetraenoate dehydratase n=1 Tax=Scleropages formosus TaxID=113540 RepID=A0A0P7THB5_SCLFO|nr:hypothetical protein Z043_121765 [Scleropages formosus]
MFCVFLRFLNRIASNPPQECPDYDNVQELKFAREVECDCVVNGIFLPKGATVEIPAGFLHYDPDHWPEPDKFIPERHPFVYLPFGAGPRSCVGMRLAQLEIRMALVHVFRHFAFVASPETKVPLELKSSSTLGPKDGIFVKITQRESGVSVPGFKR